MTTSQSVTALAAYIHQGLALLDDLTADACLNSVLCLICRIEATQG